VIDNVAEYQSRGIVMSGKYEKCFMYGLDWFEVEKSQNFLNCLPTDWKEGWDKDEQIYKEILNLERKKLIIIISLENLLKSFK